MDNTIVKTHKEYFRRGVNYLKFVVKNTYQQVSYIFFCIATWLLVEDIILPVIHSICHKYIESLSETWLVVMMGLCLLYVIILLVCKTRNKYTFSKWIIANLIVLCSIYSYYRLYSNEFVFWGWKYFYYLDIIYIITSIYILFNIIVYFRKHAIITQSHNDNILLRDDAVESEKDDVLEYKTYVQELSDLLDTVDVSKRSYSVGIVGEWGRGKSSLLNMFAKRKAEAGQIVIPFNPRSAKNIELIQEDFFVQLRSELCKYHSGIGSRIDKYAYALQLTVSTQWIYALWNILSNWSSGSEKEAINRILASIGRKIYIIIEDLDRLTGEEILEVLKLIDANGNFCNTFFLTAYDKNYVNALLKNTLTFEESNIDFTDKYFQYEYPLLKHRYDQLAGLLGKYVYDWALSITPEMYRDCITQDWWTICSYLIKNLPTIRQIKRYTNLLRSTYPKLVTKVLFPDFALLTLVRFLDLDAYWSIYNQYYISNHDKFQTLEYFKLVNDFQAKANEFPKILGFDMILRYMFDTAGIRQFQEYNRICRVESFQNYFYNDLPGKLYFEEQNQLMNLEQPLKNAIDTLNVYLNNDKHKQSVEEFLCLYKSEWIRNTSHLMRYLCLLLYVNANLNSRRLHWFVIRVFLRNSFETYLQASLVPSEKEYRKILLEAQFTMLRYAPLGIGLGAIGRLNERRVSDLYEENGCLQKDDDVQIALAAQKQYDDLYGKGDWDAWESLRIANISIADNKTLVGDAQNHLNRMLDAYPDEYARKLLVVSDVSVSKKKYSHVEIRDCIQVISMIGGHDRFKEWMTHIHSEYLKEIFQILYQELCNSNSAILRIPYIPDDRCSDYAFIVDRIKSVPSATVEEL